MQSKRNYFFGSIAMLEIIFWADDSYPRLSTSILSIYTHMSIPWASCFRNPVILDLMKRILYNYAFYIRSLYIGCNATLLHNYFNDTYIAYMFAKRMIYLLRAIFKFYRRANASGETHKQCRGVNSSTGSRHGLQSQLCNA